MLDPRCSAPPVCRNKRAIGRPRRDCFKVNEAFVDRLDTVIIDWIHAGDRAMERFPMRRRFPVLSRRRAWYLIAITFAAAVVGRGAFVMMPRWDVCRLGARNAAKRVQSFHQDAANVGIPEWAAYDRKLAAYYGRLEQRYRLAMFLPWIPIPLEDGLQIPKPDNTLPRHPIYVIHPSQVTQRPGGAGGSSMPPGR
jgi:hypothetical protein